MCPCWCAGWMSTGWPFDIPGDVELDTSLCPADALEMVAWRGFVPSPSWLTDSNLHSLCSFSHITHFRPGWGFWHRIFRRRHIAFWR